MFYYQILKKYLKDNKSDIAELCIILLLSAQQLCNTTCTPVGGV